MPTSQATHPLFCDFRRGWHGIFLENISRISFPLYIPRTMVQCRIEFNNAGFLKVLTAFLEMHAMADAYTDPVTKTRQDDIDTCVWVKTLVRRIVNSVWGCVQNTRCVLHIRQTELNRLQVTLRNNVKQVFQCADGVIVARGDEIFCRDYSYDEVVATAKLLGMFYEVLEIPNGVFFSQDTSLLDIRDPGGLKSGTSIL